MNDVLIGNGLNEGWKDSAKARFQKEIYVKRVNIFLYGYLIFVLLFQTLSFISSSFY